MDYLVHHGIKGQKWYIRRYQNPDGSLTEAGKRRYEKKAKREETKRVNSGIKETARDVTEEKKQLIKAYKKEQFVLKQFKRGRVGKEFPDKLKMMKQMSEDNYIRKLNKIEALGRQNINAVLEKTQHLSEKEKRNLREKGHSMVNGWLMTQANTGGNYGAGFGAGYNAGLAARY